MDALATWEKLLLGVFAVLILFWWFPGVKTLMRRARADLRECVQARWDG